MFVPNSSGSLFVAAMIRSTESQAEREPASPVARRMIGSVNFAADCLLQRQISRHSG